MRLTFLIHALHCGGAERATSLIAGGLCQAGHKVTVVTAAPPEKDFYSLSEGVSRRSLALPSTCRTGGVARRWRFLQRLRAELCAERPDAVISVIHKTTVRCLVALRALPVPVFGNEQADPNHQSLPVVWRALRRLLYPRLNTLVSPSTGVDRAFAWLPPTQRCVIPNPTAPPEHLASDCEPGPDLPNPRVIALARFSPEKGLDLLIDAFAAVAPACPRWHLVLAGDGPEAPRLREQVAALGLADRIHFPGLLANPYPALRTSQIFCLPSRHDAFPLSLLEAMALGVTALASACVGPLDALEHDVHGLLVPPGDTAALARNLRALMDSPPLRQRLAQAARTRAKRYALPTITEQWQGLLQAASPAHQGGR